MRREIVVLKQLFYENASNLLAFCFMRMLATCWLMRTLLFINNVLRSNMLIRSITFHFNIVHIFHANGDSPLLMLLFYLTKSNCFRSSLPLENLCIVNSHNAKVTSAGVIDDQLSTSLISHEQHFGEYISLVRCRVVCVSLEVIILNVSPCKVVNELFALDM